MPLTSSELPHEYRLLIHQYRAYLNHRNYAKRTIKEYPDAITGFLEYLLGGDVEDIREAGVKEVQGYLHESVTQAVSTQRGRLALLRNFFKFLHKTGKVYIDPCLNLEAPKLPKRLPRFLLEVHDIEKLLECPDLETFNGVRDRAMLELMYSCGLRNSELRGIELDDVDLEESRVRVMGKGSKEAYVPMGRQAHKALMHYLTFWRPKLKIKSRSVFVSWNYRRGLSARTMTNVVNKYAAMTDLDKPCTPHSFRHSCATHLLQRGADIRHIQELLRHNDLSSTQIYTRVDIKDLREAQRKFHPREAPPDEDDAGEADPGETEPGKDNDA